MRLTLSWGKKHMMNKDYSPSQEGKCFPSLCFSWLSHLASEQRYLNRQRCKDKASNSCKWINLCHPVSTPHWEALHNLNMIPEEHRVISVVNVQEASLPVMIPVYCISSSLAKKSLAQTNKTPLFKMQYKTVHYSGGGLSLKSWQRALCSSKNIIALNENGLPILINAITLIGIQYLRTCQHGMHSSPFCLQLP